MDKIILKVKNLSEIKRIDAYISEQKENFTRSKVQRLIDNKKITVNGKNIKCSYKVQENDVIKIIEEEPIQTDIKPQDIPLDVIYEDKDIIIINKPKGMVVHPANGNYEGTLVNAVMAKCKDSLSGIGGEIRPGIVHRLDKDTSGAIIVAKNDEAHVNLSNQIKNHEVTKTYIALARGIINENNATIKMPIARSKTDRKKMSVDSKGKEAITHFEVLERFENKYTLLKINIETGRTHQIRVHMSNIGHPLVGDEVYSNGKNELGVKGQCLHAWKLDFKHPITGKQMHIVAKVPEYFENLLKKLGMTGIFEFKDQNN